MERGECERRREGERLNGQWEGGDVGEKNGGSEQKEAVGREGAGAGRGKEEAGGREGAGGKEEGQRERVRGQEGDGGRR